MDTDLCMDIGGALLELLSAGHDRRDKQAETSFLAKERKIIFRFGLLSFKRGIHESKLYILTSL